MMPGVGGAMAEGLIGGLGSVFLIVVLIAVVRWIMKLSRAAKSLPQDLATKASTRKLADAEEEERLYEFARKEFESGEIRSGLWTKATSTATSSDENDIKREYIRLRVEHLHTESRLIKEAPKKVPEVEIAQSEDENISLVGTDFEDQSYDIAWTEVESGKVIAHLWSKSFAISDGDSEKAKAKYISFRVKELRDEEVNRLEQERLERIRARENRPETEVMSELGIGYDGEFYCYEKYRYADLSDAVDYAKKSQLKIKCRWCNHNNTGYGVCVNCGCAVDP